eukprot:g32417.t1
MIMWVDQTESGKITLTEIVGNMPKRIRCTDTGRVYNSTRDAALHLQLGLKTHQVDYLIQELNKTPQSPVCGFTWEWVDECPPCPTN